MKSIIKTILIIFTLVVLVSCKKDNSKIIKVGYTYQPMGEILNLIKDDIENEGYKLEIMELGLVPNNLALKDKEIDANLLQSKLYLNNFNKHNNTNLKLAFQLYHAIYSLYSSDITNLDDLKENTLITLPDDEANITRAFYLLDQAGLIKLDNKESLILTESNIILNNLNLKFEYINVDSISNRYLETKYAVMYPTFARNLNLVGNKERLYVEESDDITKDYAMGLAVNNEDINSVKTNLLIKYLKSDKIRQYLEEEYSWGSVPAF